MEAAVSLSKVLHEASNAITKSEALLPRVVQAGEALAESLVAGRHFADQEGGEDGGFEYDPRFLLFEFVWNLLLRQKQVSFCSCA